MSKTFQRNLTLNKSCWKASLSPLQLRHSFSFSMTSLKGVMAIRAPSFSMLSSTPFTAQFATLSADKRLEHLSKYINFASKSIPYALYSTWGCTDLCAQPCRWHPFYQNLRRVSWLVRKLLQYLPNRKRGCVPIGSSMASAELGPRVASRYWQRRPSCSWIDDRTSRISGKLLSCMRQYLQNLKNEEELVRSTEDSLTLKVRGMDTQEGLDGDLLIPKTDRRLGINHSVGVRWMH